MNITIDIQKPCPTYNTFNEPELDWKNYLSELYASAINTGGKEFYAAQKLNAETTTVFKIRYQPGILPTMRVKYGSRYFNILNINNVNEKNEYILLSCKEVV